MTIFDAGGRRYEILVASDVDRDTLHLECIALNPEDPSVILVRRDSGDLQVEFVAGSAVPAMVISHLLRLAEDEL